MSVCVCVCVRERERERERETDRQRDRETECVQVGEVMEGEGGIAFKRFSTKIVYKHVTTTIYRPWPHTTTFIMFIIIGALGAKRTPNGKYKFPFNINSRYYFPLHKCTPHYFQRFTPNQPYNEMIC